MLKFLDLRSLILFSFEVINYVSLIDIKKIYNILFLLSAVVMVPKQKWRLSADAEERFNIGLTLVYAEFFGLVIDVVNQYWQHNRAFFIPNVFLVLVAEF